VRKKNFTQRNRVLKAQSFYSFFVRLSGAEAFLLSSKLCQRFETLTKPMETLPFRQDENICFKFLI
jgi:hypothetical protein